MPKFHPGQHVRIVTSNNHPHLVGKEATILALIPTPSEERRGRFGGEQWYSVDIPGNPPPMGKSYWRGPESTFEPLLDARTWFERNIKVPTETVGTPKEHTHG